ncbi:nuclear transport factor 2 family protein [Billgrantia kenyensis]|uniref:Nuclear transport factor 2 family protein n=1 Tax=Billgrantia kenyensis TaxID=321266 RepID=A0A7V9W4W0_9GAMM|nr:nuclear transport factor 2 family protein [Halomonas kenyensis]MBA2781025.1 nuclear transport factor 2 family protein [Halomonas kenyensis]MCG6663750.1 nuclear transport factor 2 family protein [Halomonas kenyensis]
MEKTVQERLIETRRQWYAAYIGGNVGQLDHIESDDFVVINEAGLQGKLDQLGSIAEAVAHDRWFGRGSRVEDEIVKSVPLGEVVSIHGQGRIVDDSRESSEVYFSELWRKVDGQWRVLALHFTRVPQF